MINLLKEKFNIVFEHGTDVPGLADGLKHLDGFLSLTEKLGFLFYKKSFSASRSAVGDTLDPVKCLGLDKAIKELSKEAEIHLTNSSPLTLIGDFNHLITGSREISEAAKVLKEVGLANLIEGISNRIIDMILEQCKGHYSPETEINEILEEISKSGKKTIHVKLFVQRMDVVGQLCTLNKKFIDACKSNFLKKIGDQLDFDSKNIVIHYRRGDTAVFPLPNGKFIAAWGNWRRSPNKSSNPEILESPEDAAYKPFDFSTTFEILKSAVENSQRPANVILLSDGFERGIERLSEFSNVNNLTEEDIIFAKNWADSEKDSFINKFRSIFEAEHVATKVFWGESEHSFMDSVKSIATADVLFASVGGFSKTIFSIYNVKEHAIILGPSKEENATWLENKVKSIICD